MKPRYMKIADREIGDGHPAFLVAEGGLNHNGDINIAKRLMDEAKSAGFDAIKWQKRTPDVCTPRSQWDKVRQTPWGEMTYIQYRHRIEFWETEYDEIDRYSKEIGLPWFASVWDAESVDFLERYDVPAYKIPSAGITDLSLLSKVRATGKPVIMSTGMSTMEQIVEAYNLLRDRDGIDFLNYSQEDLVAVLHCTSTYPADPSELNMRMVTTLRYRFPLSVVGYSGHEVSLTQSVASIALGAQIIERHVTLDRTMWGGDHAASVEPGGMHLLVKRIRRLEASLGDGVKRVYDSEQPILEKLRRV